MPAFRDSSLFITFVNHKKKKKIIPGIFKLFPWKEGNGGEEVRGGGEGEKKW